MELIIDKVLALKPVQIFSEIPENILADIAGIIETETYAPGEVLIRKGELGDSLYIIHSGTVEVYDENAVFATLGQHEIVGELSLLAPISRTASVRAKETATVFKIEREYFMDLLFQEPEIVKGIFRVLVERITELNKALKKG